MKNRENAQAGQAALLLAIVVSIVMPLSINLFHEFALKSYRDNLRYTEIPTARASFEAAAKKLRYMYETLGACDPAKFAQAVSSLPNPSPVGGQPVLDLTLCAPDFNRPEYSCRALEIGLGGIKSRVIVYVGLVSLSRVDVPCSPGSDINDFRPDCEDSVPQSSVGVHLRTVLNNSKYEQWIVLLNTCSTMLAPYPPAVAPTSIPKVSKGIGLGFGKGYALGTAYSPMSQPIQTPPVCKNPNKRFGDIDNSGTIDILDLITFRRLITAIQIPFDPATEFPDLQCMDLNQDGVLDERDLNVFEKFLMGWIQGIPVRL